jgi:hypothetical protein
MSSQSYIRCNKVKQRQTKLNMITADTKKYDRWQKNVDICSSFEASRGKKFVRLTKKASREKNGARQVSNSAKRQSQHMSCGTRWREEKNDPENLFGAKLLHRQHTRLPVFLSSPKNRPPRPRPHPPVTHTYNGNFGTTVRGLKPLRLLSETRLGFRRTKTFFRTNLMRHLHQSQVSGVAM